jgi:hypothetical protein
MLEIISETVAESLRLWVGIPGWFVKLIGLLTFANYQSLLVKIISIG